MVTLTILQGPDKGRVFHADELPVLIGRASKVVALTDITVSRRHAELRREDGHWIIDDLKSSNGTFVNGKRVEGPARLKHGDTVRVGSTVFAWSGDAEAAAAATDLVDLDVGGKVFDSSIVSSIASGDDSVILASPVAADAVRAWRVIAAFSEAVSTVVTPQQLIERVMDILFDEVPAGRGFILMKDETGGEFQPTVVRYRGPAESPEKIVTSRTLIDHVVSRREGLLCTNAMSDERFSGRRRSGSIQAFGLRSILCVPITAGDEILGVLHVDTPMAQHVYTEPQLRLVTAIGRMAGLAVENARLVSRRMELTRLAATGTAVAVLAHSIKNILQGLRGGADVVEMGLARQQLGTVDQGWQTVQRSLEKTYTLVMNMLAYSKDREPRLELEQLNPIVREVLAQTRRRAEDRGARVVVDLEDPIPPIPLDPDGIQQAVFNLLANAIDAVPKSTGVINLRTRFDAAASEAVLSIADNGPGIPPEQRAHLFDPFHSTKGQGGTGLGLAVTRKIADEHHGRIEIKSEPGHGTIVTLALPAIPPPQADSHATLAPPSRPPDPRP